MYKERIDQWRKKAKASWQAHAQPIVDDVRQRLFIWFDPVRDFLNRYRKLWHWTKIAVAWLGIFAASVYIAFCWLVMLVWLGYFGKLPDAPELSGIRNNTASELYAQDSSLLGKYYIENRTTAKLSNMSPWLSKALVSTEDSRFYTHNGNDVRAWGRVLWRSIIKGDKSGGGGSTITQQLAKNLYGRKEYRYGSIAINKLREIMIAHRLEKVYSKNEILALYLNTVPFGDAVFGIEAASQQYFASDSRDLKLEEAATLIGMLKATNSYHPVRKPSHSLERRNTVLALMRNDKHITQRVCDSLMECSMMTEYRKENHHSGLAPYFREHLRLELESILEKTKNTNGKPYNLYTDGLRIYTSIDPKLQAYAEHSVNKHMSELQQVFDRHWKGRSLLSKKAMESLIKKTTIYQELSRKLTHEQAVEQMSKLDTIVAYADGDEREIPLSAIDSIAHYYSMLQAGFLAAEVKNGWVRAWVGGIDHRYFQYDHVLSKRQVGSTFKPVVYAAALLEGLHPCDYYTNEQKSYQKYENWEPRNSDGVYEGAYSMSGALQKSINTISVQLAMEAGLDNIIKLAKEMGVESDIPEVPSIALGTAELSLWEMVQLYATFANEGRWQPLRYLIRIEDAAGNLIYEPEPQKSKRVLNQREAQIINALLQDVVKKGTGRRLGYRFAFYDPFAGKTGTTQSHADGWFVGYTPYIVTGAWVGGSYPQVRFRSIGLGQGANTALPIVGQFMHSIRKDKTYKSWWGQKFALHDSLQVALECEPYLDTHPDSSYSIFTIETLDDVFRIFGNKNKTKEERTEERRKRKQQKMWRRENELN